MSGEYLDISVQLASDADAYLTAYNARFVDAPIGQASTYLDPYIFIPQEGVENRVRVVRFPIPLTAVELKLYKGRSRFVKGSTRYISVRKKPYQAGESAFYKTIVDPNWGGFSKSPERLRKLCASWPTKQAARLINTGETISSWKGTTFLSASVPVNPFSKTVTTTYKTFWAATTLTHDNVLAMIADMTAREDLEGDPMPFGEIVLFASGALFPTAMSVVNDEYIDGTRISNPLKKWNIKVERWHHLSPTRWGIVNGAAVDEYPLFMGLIGQEEFYVWGQDSAMFEDKKHMGYEVMKDLGLSVGRNEALSVASTV